MWYNILQKGGEKNETTYRMGKRFHRIGKSFGGADTSSGNLND